MKWLKAELVAPKKWLHLADPKDIAKLQRKYRNNIPGVSKDEPYNFPGQTTSFGDAYKGSGGSGEGDSYDHSPAPGLHTDFYPADYGQNNPL